MDDMKTQGTPSPTFDALGLGLAPGSAHYRAFVGYPFKYDLVAAMQFNLLTFLGLREHHRVLDVGCGSLRAGRLLIPYLLAGHYFGIEPEEWLLKEGIQHETGQELIQLKGAAFQCRSDFRLTSFGVDFDFILAQSIFSHSGVPDIRTCLTEAAGCLAPEGLIVASFVLDKDDYAESDWVYPACIGYTESTMKQLAGDAGLQCMLIDWPHPNTQTWALYWRGDMRQAPSDPTYRYSKPCVSAVEAEFVEQDSGAGFFDGLCDVGESWLLYGWAIDPLAKRPANAVLIVDRSRLIGSARVDVERPDVARAHGNPILQCGFQARLSKKLLHRGRELKCYAYLPDQGKALRLSGAFAPAPALSAP
jgi:SAM-dependent methyltransferase